VVVNAGVKEHGNKSTLQSECRSARKNNWTGPTLLEMSDYPVNQELSDSCQMMLTSPAHQTYD
jgi:hypothetical protein